MPEDLYDLRDKMGTVHHALAKAVSMHLDLLRETPYFQIPYAANGAQIFIRRIQRYPRSQRQNQVLYRTVVNNHTAEGPFFSKALYIGRSICAVNRLFQRCGVYLHSSISLTRRAVRFIMVTPIYESNVHDEWFDR